MLESAIKFKMSQLLNQRSINARYSAFENRSSVNLEEPDFEIVNIYNTKHNVFQTENGDKKRPLCERFYSWFCCCKKTYREIDQSAMFDDSNSVLVTPLRRSYRLKNSSSTKKKQDQPILIVTRPLNDDLHEFKSESRNPTPIETSPSACDITPKDSNDNSRCGTFKFGEKNTFIREVLSCRDSFLEALEWCDNSLTRGKKYRKVVKDEWQKSTCDGTTKV